MASQAMSLYARPGVSAQLGHVPRLFSQSQCIYRRQMPRNFSSTRQCRQKTQYKDSFGRRLRKALGDTKIKWYPIPVGVGIGFLGLGQLYRVNEREKARRREEEQDDGYVKIGGESGNGQDGQGGRPKRRERIRPTGPWSVVPLLRNKQTLIKM